jgi:plastocyanin
MVHSNKSAAVAVAATGALLAAGGGIALGAAHTSHVRAALIPTPKYTVTVTGQHNAPSTMTVSGPHTISAGRIALKLKAVHGEQAIEVIRIKPGYSYKQARHDFNEFAASFASNSGPTKAELRALRRVVHGVVFMGGLDSGSFKTARGTLVLAKPGHYLLVNDENGPAPHPFKIKVTAKVGNRAAPHSSAFVKAITAKRFRGARVLPAKGTITFHNASTQSPHFLVLQHVAKGTTRREIIKSFNSPSSGPPPFARPENADTDVVGMGHTMTLTYNLPPGTYAEMCFFPDLQTGMPHAAMGMVRIVHLV